MQKSLSFITLFKALNLVMEFVVFIAFSLQFSAPENPSVHPVIAVTITHVLCIYTMPLYAIDLSHFSLSLPHQQLTSPLR